MSDKYKPRAAWLDYENQRGDGGIFDEGKRPEIDVMDEDFGHPYDYQAILRGNPDFEFAKGVKDLVDDQLESLAQKGIITGFNRGMYV